MTGNDPFGPGDDDVDRFMREMGDGLKDLVGKFLAGQGGQLAWSTFTEAARRPSPAASANVPEPAVPVDSAPAGGVWAVVSSGDDGTRVEQVFVTELEALRAHQHNTDPGRRVRFLPFGIPVDALDGE
ncbi:hypothetical protein [Gordonia sp. (in: high G+C Gram-positive bacteria)]|uniref:hypothetical protein n=1 Tax=Gordonia sp. (in: high G+C Gram-positive bacteria) TaxID=84139 RepID=UPI0035272722